MLNSIQKFRKDFYLVTRHTTFHVSYSLSFIVLLYFDTLRTRGIFPIVLNPVLCPVHVLMQWRFRLNKLNRFVNEAHL